jgi:hypothetical protein
MLTEDRVTNEEEIARGRKHDFKSTQSQRIQALENSKNETGVERLKLELQDQ